jgi:hypothetical protein
MGDSIFNRDQLGQLSAVLDEIIPEDGARKLPGAGSIGLAGAVEDAARRNPGMGAVIAQGLVALQQVLGERGLASLASAPRGDRAAIVKEVEARDAGFILTLMFVAYAAYYQDRRVLDGLGLEPRPPHPKGYAMAPDDLSLLDPVRRRGKLYRPV